MINHYAKRLKNQNLWIILANFRQIWYDLINEKCTEDLCSTSALLVGKEQTSPRIFLHINAPKGVEDCLILGFNSVLRCIFFHGPLPAPSQNVQTKSEKNNEKTMDGSSPTSWETATLERLQLPAR